jgi:hypothetical protein
MRRRMADWVAASSRRAAAASVTRLAGQAHPHSYLWNTTPSQQRGAAGGRCYRCATAASLIVTRLAMVWPVGRSQSVTRMLLIKFVRPVVYLDLPNGLSLICVAPCCLRCSGHSCVEHLLDGQETWPRREQSANATMSVAIVLVVLRSNLSLSLITNKALIGTQQGHGSYQTLPHTSTLLQANPAEVISL